MKRQQKFLTGAAVAGAFAYWLWTKKAVATPTVSVQPLYAADLSVVVYPADGSGSYVISYGDLGGQPNVSDTLTYAGSNWTLHQDIGGVLYLLPT